MSNKVKNDTYLRFVDLRYNQCSVEDIQEFLPYFKMNRSIVALDMRFNPGFQEDIHKRVALVLLKNIEAAFKKKIYLKDSWIIKPLIFISIPTN